MAKAEYFLNFEVLCWIFLIASKRSFSSCSSMSFCFCEAIRRNCFIPVRKCLFDSSRWWRSLIFPAPCRSSSSTAFETDRSMVLTLRFSTCLFTILSWEISCANLRMLLTIRPRIMIPPTLYGNMSPLDVSLRGWKSPKPTVKMVTCSVFERSYCSRRGDHTYIAEI